MPVDPYRTRTAQKGANRSASQRQWWELTCSVVAAIALLLSSSALSLRAQEPVQFVGGAACSDCHRTEAELWTNSHHAKAMQPATSDTVLGAFNNTEHSQDGITTRFSRSGEDYVVQTEGADLIRPLISPPIEVRQTARC